MTGIAIAPIDWIVLIGYLVLVTAVGVIASFKIRDSAQYFLGGRRFGKAIMIAQSFGTGTHAEMPVSLAGIVYTIGLSGIWYQWKNLFATPFYWLIAPLFRRFRRTTIAEVVEDRYGPWMGAIYAAFALCFFTINMASMLKGAAKVINQAIGAGLTVNQIVLVMTAVFVLYSFIGGLLASAWTDFIQGFLILALSFMLIPLGWHLIGGMAGMKASLPASRFSLVTPQGIGPWFIAVLTLNGLVGIIAQPQMIAAVGTGKDEFSCRVGHLYGTFIKRFCTIGWALVGLLVATVVARGTFGVSRLADPEEAFGFACRHLLFPGGIGLLIASFLAANMAACSAFMVDSGALFTNAIYRRYLVPSASDRQCLRVGRLSGLAITFCAVLYAVFLIDRVLYSFLLTETMATFVGISILGGVVWRRANRWGAAASLCTAVGVNFAGYKYLGQRPDYWDPNVFLVALVVGLAALVLGSLLTPAEPASRTAHFYENIQSPSDGAIDQEARPDPLDIAKAGRLLVVVNLLNLRRGALGLPLWRAYRTDLVGFVGGWMIAAALLAGTILMFRAM
jgi:Na+/proline symporter